MQCGNCGGDDFTPGFLEDRGEGSMGYGRWIEGDLERGIFGGAKAMGKQRWAVAAYRCSECGHLELFATEAV